MIGASISDLHLGFRAYSAMVGGRNAREVDVERAWLDVVRTITDSNECPWDERPSIVTIAGDIFHNPRVSMFAVKAFRDGLRKLTMDYGEPNGTVVVIVQGNHDAGRTAEVLSPIIIPDDLPNVVVVTQPQVVPIDMGGDGCMVHCFPFTVLQDESQTAYKLSPRGELGIDILLMHAAVKGDAEGDKLPHFYGGLGALDVSKEADRFDVVAVGDYHEFTRLHPEKLAFYSGSIERTSSDIWKEREPKGVVYWNTAVGGKEGVHDMQFVPTWSRPMFDSIALVATAEELNSELEGLLVPHRDGRLSSLEGNIHRMVVREFPRSERDGIDWKLVRELKQVCLHFQFDVEWQKKEAGQVKSGRDADKRQTLTDDAADFFADDPAPVRDLALAYLTPESEGGEA